MDRKNSNFSQGVNLAVELYYQNDASHNFNYMPRLTKITEISRIDAGIFEERFENKFGISLRDYADRQASAYRNSFPSLTPQQMIQGTKEKIYLLRCNRLDPFRYDSVNGIYLFSEVALNGIVFDVSRQIDIVGEDLLERVQTQKYIQDQFDSSFSDMKGISRGRTQSKSDTLEFFIKNNDVTWIKLRK